MNARPKDRTPHRTFRIDDWEILVGKSDEENDALTFAVAKPDDTWMHVEGFRGSHVVVRGPAETPESVLDVAAALAVWYSKAKDRGEVAVHVCPVSNVFKRDNDPAGLVRLSTFTERMASSRNPKGLNRSQKSKSK